MRLVVLVLALLFAICGAEAKPNLPTIADAAASYRALIQSKQGSKPVLQVLADIKRAEATGNVAERTRLYEQLVALDQHDVRAWLRLAAAWRAADAGSANGLSAAFSAYAEAARPADQVEALLSMSSFLRGQLEACRDDYDAAQVVVRQTEANLHDLDTKQGASGASAETRQLLVQTEDRANASAASVSVRIQSLAANLDEVYAALAAALPGLNPEAMKTSDGRAKMFEIVDDPIKKEPRVEFTIDGSGIRGCLSFTQDLKQGDLGYGDFVEVELADPGDQPSEAVTAAAAKIGASATASGRKLCLSGFKPGGQYKLTIKAGLPGKNDARLSAASSIESLQVMDLPRRIIFSGSHFVLPRSGTGQIAVHTTNMDSFQFELFRITDRTLYRQLALGHLSGALPAAEYDDLTNHFGERMWRGTVLMPTSRKENEPVGADLPVRALLDDRLDWLRREIAGHAGKSLPELASGLRFLGSQSEKKAGLKGEYFAGPADFEAATLNTFMPGVYALVTANPENCGTSCDGYLTQWFVETDIGLSFYEGDQTVSVVGRSLSSGQAKVGATVQLVTAGNRVLASGVTDANGVVTFPRSLTRGTQSNAVAAILVQAGDDFSFMEFGADRLDLSRLNVDGHPLQQGLDAFLTTDRGIYQHGDRIELLALLRDDKGRSPDLVPATTIRGVTRDRTLFERRIRPDEWKLGGVEVSIALPDTIRRGPVRLELATGGGPNDVIGSTDVTIGPISPDQVTVDFLDTARDWSVRSAKDLLMVDGKVGGRYIFGATDASGAAKDLKVETVVRLAATNAPAPACGDAFAFGAFDDDTMAFSSQQFDQFTDANGVAALSLRDIPIPPTTKPLSATVEVTLFDKIGPVGSRSLTKPIDDGKGWIGLPKAPRLRPGIGPGRHALDVDLVLTGGDYATGAVHRLSIDLEKEIDDYTWQRQDDDTWQHKRSVRPVGLIHRDATTADLVDVPGVKAASASGCDRLKRLSNLADTLDVGQYILSVTDADTHRVTSMRFKVGASQTDPDQLEPNIFVLSTDKTSYQSGETITLTAEVPFDGEVLIGFAQGDIRDWTSTTAKNGVAKVAYHPPAGLAGRGIYALATVFRSNADGSVQAGPSRAIGAASFSIGTGTTSYAAAIERSVGKAPDYLLPGEDIDFRVCLSPSGGPCPPEHAALPDNLPGEAYAVAYVVDQGLLSLTGFQTPDPREHFYGRPRLGVRIMDNYGRLLLREGGDRPGRLALSNYTSDHVIAAVSDVVPVRGGQARFTFKDLGFVGGRAAISVVVWSKDFATSASLNLDVHSQVIADLRVPGFVLAGDQVIVPLRLQNVDYHDDKPFSVRLTAEDFPGIVGLAASKAQLGTPSAELQETLPLGVAKTVYAVLRAPAGGRGKLALKVDVRPIGAQAPLDGGGRSWALDMRPPALSTVESLSFPLGATPADLVGLVKSAVAGRFEPDSVSVTARFADTAGTLLASSAAVSEPGRTPMLDQLVIRGFNLLHRIASDAGPADRARMSQIVGNVLSLQLADGSFLPYRTIDDPSWTELNRQQDVGGGDEGEAGVYRATNALDLLLAAQAKGFPVPSSSIKAAQQFMSAWLLARGSSGVCSVGALYAMLVLTEARQVNPAEVKDVSHCELQEDLTRSAAAAVQAQFGRTDEARLTLAKLVTPASDPAALAGRNKTDLAMMLRFLAEADAPPAMLEAVSAAIASDRAGELPPAVAAWTAGAAPFLPRSTLKPGDLHLDGLTLGALRQEPDGSLAAEPVSLNRLVQSDVAVSLARPRAARGYLEIEGIRSGDSPADLLRPRALTERWFSMKDGKEIDPGSGSLMLGDRLLIVVEGQRDGLKDVLGQTSDAQSNDDRPLVLAHLLPSAFSVVEPAALDRKGVALPPALAKIHAVGDLRSIESDADRWIAVIIPESRRLANKDKADDDGAEKAAGSPPPDGPEFRQGFVVRVNAAGHFALPGMTIEAATSFATTYRTASRSVTVAIPDDAR